ncbi:MAG TPA: hypothetical protein VHU40_21615, partial [Polyangia bacterium]|nr:hypothetical protein [Polyangia bacterium]
MQLDVGPLLRTLRRQPGVLALFVLEIAAGVSTISALLLSGSWYLHISQRPSGVDEENLILVSTYETGRGPAGGDPEAAILAQQQSDRARIRALPEVAGLTQLSTCVLDDRWSYPALYTSRRPDGTRLAEEVGWGVHADDQVATVLHAPFLAG